MNELYSFVGIKKVYTRNNEYSLNCFFVKTQSSEGKCNQQKLSWWMNFLIWFLEMFRGIKAF